MSVSELVQALQRRWQIALASVLLCVVGAALLSVLATPSYTSTARIFVSTPVQSGNADQLYQGGSFSSDRVKSYAELATSPAVVAPVIRQLSPSDSIESFTQRVDVDAPTGTVLLNISVSDDDSGRSAQLANALAGQLSTVVESLERVRPTDPSPVRATIVAEAITPDAPTWPNVTVNLAIGLLIGLSAALLAVVLAEYLDQTVKSSDELRTLTDRTVLGSIAKRDFDSAGLVLREAPTDRVSENFRSVRAALQFASVDETIKSIVVTSSVQGEGKSFVACNLALAHAEAGYRVCIVDSDLRRPSLDEKFGIVGDVGLTNVLIGRVRTSEVSQRVAGNLTVVSAGPRPPNPSELLSSRRMENVLRELEDQYDLVIVDSPPVLPVADAMVLAGLAHGSVFVCRANSTSRAAMTRALQNLKETNNRVLGVILNMASLSGRDIREYKYEGADNNLFPPLDDAQSVTGRPSPAPRPGHPTTDTIGGRRPTSQHR